jgi:hypothetical protein
VRLIYWAPGVIESASTHLRITASETCSRDACPVREKAGKSVTTLTVKPYLIYEHSGKLSEENIKELAAWAGGTALFTRFLKVTTTAETTLKLSLKFMDDFQIAAEKASEALKVLEKVPVERVFAALEFVKVFSELWERSAMLDLFFKVNALSPAGLGANPSEASASAGPTPAFDNKLVNYGVVVPFNLGADGLWWGIAESLRYLQEHHDPAFRPLPIKLDIYEVSHCDPTLGRCGSGYRNAAGTDLVDNEGLQPELYVQFYVGWAHSKGVTGGSVYDFRIPYDAIAWTQTQPLLGKLRGVLP